MLLLVQLEISLFGKKRTQNMLKFTKSKGNRHKKLLKACLGPGVVQPKPSTILSLIFIFDFFQGQIPKGLSLHFYRFV